MEFLNEHPSPLQSLRKAFQPSEREAIYGEPISAHGKTVVPVAKNNVWLRAGRTGGVGDSSARGEGGGRRWRKLRAILGRYRDQ